MFWYIILAVVAYVFYSLFKTEKNLRDVANPVKKKVVIIGAGVSGLTVAKSMLEEGHDVQVLEKADSFGGVWRFDNSKDRTFNSGQVWQNLVTTSSTWVTSFSDFTCAERTDDIKTYPHAKHSPFHMSHQQYRNYLEGYMKENGVAKTLRFKITVKSTKLLADNRWELVIQHADKKQPETLQADFVVVATGQHQNVKAPSIPGLEDFKGNVVHSTDYVNAAPFQNRRVLIIGGGDSSADIVKHISEVSKPGETYLCLRSGVHVLPRMGLSSVGGMSKFPADYNIMRAQFYRSLPVRTRALDSLPKGLKMKVQKATNSKDEAFAKEIYRMHYMLGGKTEDTYFATKSAEMCQALADGAAQLRPGLKGFEGNIANFQPASTILNDESVCSPIVDTSVEVDDVVLCTGFKTYYPFLPEDYQSHSDVERYNLVFHPDLPNMGFAGFVRPSGLGAIPPLAEMQGRWMAQVVSGRAVLPDKASLDAHVKQHKMDFFSARPNANTHTFCQFLCYLNTIGGLIDVKPNLAKMFFTDNALWKRMMFGPFSSHQFRYQGIHSKPEYVRKTLFDGQHATYRNKRAKPVIVMAMATKAFLLSLIPGPIGQREQPLLHRKKILAA